MKKAIIILAIITTGIALLFAQTPAEPVPEEAVLAPAPTEVEKKVEEPLPVEAMIDDEGLGADEITMTIEIGEDALIEEGRISLRLKDAELKDVIRMFGALSDANIIVPDLGEEEIKRKIDVTLDNVEWQPALEAILDTHELELYEKIPASQVYSIRAKTPGAPEALDVKVFKLSYASVNSVTGIVAGLVGATGSYSVFPERNVVVAQGTAKALQRVGLIMQQIDLPRQQVFIEAKFLELSDRAQRDLGVNWEVLQAYGIGASGMGGTYSYMDSKTDGINNSQSSGGNLYTDIAGQSYEKLEEAPNQEWVETLNNPGNFEWNNGIDYASRPINFPGDERIFGIVPTTLSESLDTVTSVDNALVARTLGATLSASDFNLILSALEQKDGVDLVSNPKIIVANEETANIYIGTKEPNILQETTQVENTAPITTFKLDPNMPYFEYGIRLDVTPTVNTSSNIAVRISPSIKRFVRDKPAGFNTFPITSEKTINTVFSLESGQTAAIGGLTETEERQTENKIPWLGSLPLVGRFFSYQQTILDQKETIIFVTVGLANPSSIDMETGLPSRTKLAQRYAIREAAELRIAKEEAALLKVKEEIELQKELLDLREANQKLIEKQAATETKAVEKQEAEEVKAAEKEAKAIANEKAKADAAAAQAAEDAQKALAVEELIEEAPVDLPAEDPAEEPVVEEVISVKEVTTPVDPSANFSSDLSSIAQGVVEQASATEEPVAEKKPSLEKIIESLEPVEDNFGGGSAATNSTK